MDIRQTCPLSRPVDLTKLQRVDLVSWRQKNSQRRLRKKEPEGGKRESAMSLEIKGEHSRTEVGTNFKKEGMVRIGCYKRPSEIRTERGSFGLAIYEALEDRSRDREAVIKAKLYRGKEKMGSDQVKTKEIEKSWLCLKK